MTYSIIYINVLREQVIMHQSADTAKTNLTQRTVNNPKNAPPPPPHNIYHINVTI